MITPVAEMSTSTRTAESPEVSCSMTTDLAATRTQATAIASIPLRCRAMWACAAIAGPNTVGDSSHSPASETATGIGARRNHASRSIATSPGPRSNTTSPGSRWRDGLTRGIANSWQ